MDVKVARQIQRAASHLGIVAEVRENYSGREMSGVVTAGVVFERHNARFPSAIGLAIRHASDPTPIRRDVDRIRRDDMGCGFVIY